MLQELTAGGRESVHAVALLDDAGVAELAQTLGEDRGRHFLAARPQLGVAQRVVAQLPEHAQRPAAAEEVEEARDGMPMLALRIQKR